MNIRPKRLPRLWCARLGLLPWQAAAESPECAVGTPAGGRQGPEFASTHPSSATRIAHLREIMPRAQAEYHDRIKTGR